MLTIKFKLSSLPSLDDIFKFQHLYVYHRIIHYGRPKVTVSVGDKCENQAA